MIKGARNLMERTSVTKVREATEVCEGGIGGVGDETNGWGKSCIC